MSVAVFTSIQLPSSEVSPAHFSNRRLALALVAARLAKWLYGKNKAIQLLVKESWASIKQRFKPIESEIGVTVVERHVLNAPGYHCMNMLAYPPNSQESGGKVRQREIWLKATRF